MNLSVSAGAHHRIGLAPPGGLNGEGRTTAVSAISCRPWRRQGQASTPSGAGAWRRFSGRGRSGVEQRRLHAGAPGRCLHAAAPAPLRGATQTADRVAHGDWLRCRWSGSHAASCRRRHGSVAALDHRPRRPGVIAHPAACEQKLRSRRCCAQWHRCRNPSAFRSARGVKHLANATHRSQPPCVRSTVDAARASRRRTS